MARLPVQLVPVVLDRGPLNGVPGTDPFRADPEFTVVFLVGQQVFHNPRQVGWFHAADCPAKQV